MIEKQLVYSGVFPDESSAASALGAFSIVKKGGRMFTEKEPITKDNFRDYLVECCGVERKDTDIAIYLLGIENIKELSKVVRKIEKHKKLDKKFKTIDYVFRVRNLDF